MLYSWRTSPGSMYTILLYVAAQFWPLFLGSQPLPVNREFGIMFYNVENLFHPSNDSLTNDDEFTPGGSYHWTYSRYLKKINRIAKVIIGIGEGVPPAIIGLCEIENQQVLHDLTQRSIIAGLNYSYIHKDSPDLRGIDVALLYNPDVFQPVSYDVLNLPKYEMEQNFLTRDILYVRGILSNGQEVHFFVNHWPSRRGGAVESDWRRIKMAYILRQKVDDILQCNEGGIIVIMGDFNDEPRDKSIIETLGAGIQGEDGNDYKLINLMHPFYKKGEGTHYRMNNFTEANLIDQFIVSQQLFTEQSSLSINAEGVRIYKNPTMTVEKNGLPFRTYQGLKYIGGFSDHFPIYLNLKINPCNEK